MTMLYRIRHIETNSSKLIILELWIENVLAHRKNLKVKNWRNYLNQTDQTLEESMLIRKTLKIDILCLCFKTFKNVKSDPETRTLGMVGMV